MKRKWILFFAVFLMLFIGIEGLSLSKEQPEETKTKAMKENPISMMTQAMTDRLVKKLHVKNIVGDPMKVGNVTIIPIIMIDIGYGGGAGGPSGAEQMGSGFYMSGETRPLGFIIISKAGVRFLSAGKAPRK